jgi:glutathione peroxidase
MLATSSVKGTKANAMFKALASQTQKTPTWNFNKYLIETSGGSAQHFDSSVTPSNLEDDVVSLLGGE